ncbi:hypothetical protein BH24ACT15_BH24ACT15_31670 [soil metagenome]
MSRLGVGIGNRSRGQSLVEFALILPLIVLMIMGILDFGRGIFAYNTLAESARQANRLAIVDQDVANVQAVAIAHAPAVGLTTSDVDVCFKDAQAPPLNRTCANSASACNPIAMGCLAIVQTRTSFVPITPVISNLGFFPLDLRSTSVGPIEYVCPTSTRTTCP